MYTTVVVTLIRERLEMCLTWIRKFDWKRKLSHSLSIASWTVLAFYQIQTVPYTSCTHRYAWILYQLVSSCPGHSWNARLNAWHSPFTWRSPAIRQKWCRIDGDSYAQRGHTNNNIRWFFATKGFFALYPSSVKLYMDLVVSFGHSWLLKTV